MVTFPAGEIKCPHPCELRCLADGPASESKELFGHQQGAFTGAIKDKPGKFELANRGTLLLDEIGEISPQMQAKLLHVLQDGQFTRLGGQQAVKVDLQILAATNIDMEEALTDKTFREDLYYRLNTFTIRVPPLRDRREEIPYLMEETMRRTPSEMRAETFDRVSTRLMDAAMQYDWPGNLRELRNFITRTTIMQDQEEALRELEQKTQCARRVRKGTAYGGDSGSQIGHAIDSAGCESAYGDADDSGSARCGRMESPSCGTRPKYQLSCLAL